MTIRVLIADDHDLIRTGLRMILDAQPDIEVVAEAVNGREAVEIARRTRPDVCLFDIRMPELDGLEATRLLAGPEVADPLAVVVVTTFDLDEYVHEALREAPGGSCSRTPGPNCWFRPSMQQRRVMRSSRRASPPDCSRPSPEHLLQGSRPSRSIP
ncbi:MAG: response regulator transcription factor [Microthrixaceae bacterium]